MWRLMWASAEVRREMTEVGRKIARATRHIRTEGELDVARRERRWCSAPLVRKSEAAGGSRRQMVVIKR